MILEGNLLIGILIVTALVICALGVYLRFAMRKEQGPTEAESLFGRLLKFDGKNEQDRETAQAGKAAAETNRADGLSLPPPVRGGNVPPAEELEKKAPFSVGIGSIFSGLLGGRKNKDQVKEEVRAIDEQLNSVLQETGEINVLGLTPQTPPGDAPLSDGRGMREIDMEMGALQGPLEIVSPEEFKIEPPALDVAPLSPEPPKSEEAAIAGKKPDVSPTPVDAEAAKPLAEIKREDRKGAGDDLLADLEASAKQEEQIDLSIMKEYQDMPITCNELESDLTGILDQITINAGRKNQRT